MKTYILTLSKTFPQGHARQGELTNFRDAISPDGKTQYKKLHTIRANYELWEKRVAEIQRGEAVLDIRQWSGKPYRSKQEKIATLTAKDGVGVQLLTVEGENIENATLKVAGAVLRLPHTKLAANDGLSEQDWHEWFKGYDLTKPMAIIHFTHYRYL